MDRRGVPPSGSQPVDPLAPLRSFKLPPTKSRPVLVQSVITIPANSSAPGNSVNLVNPNGQAMYVKEVKFALAPFNPDLSAADYAAGAFAHGFMSGGQCSVELALGAIPLTNGPVPVWNFGLARFLDLEQVQAYPDSAVAAETSREAYYTWTLKHPLYVPPNSAVSVSARNIGLVPQDTQLTVALSGVTTEDSAPRELWLPFVASWTSKPFEQRLRGADRSSPTDLVNMFDEELHVERLTGRLVSTFLPRNVVAISPLVTDSSCDVVEYGAIESMIQVTAKTSAGAPLVREATPFRLVFGARNRGWDVNTVLPAKQFVRVELAKALQVDPYFNIAATEHLTQAFIGMVGWRKVTT